MCTMAITASAMVATIFVGNLYETKDRPVPTWAQIVLLRYAARLLGYCNRCVDSPPGFQPPSSPRPPPPAPPSQDEATDRDDDDDDDGRSSTSGGWHRASYRLATLQSAPSDNGVDGSEVYRPRSPSTSPGVRLIVRGPSAVAGAAGRRRGQVEAARSYSKDWTSVGAVCDRLFFWLCLCLAVTTTVVLFRPLITRPAAAAFEPVPGQ